MKITFSFLLLWFISPVFIIAQDNLDFKNKSKSISVHIMYGIKISEQHATGSHETSNIGVETQISYHRGPKWGIQLKAGWMRWADSRETYVPLVIGPEFLIDVSDNIQLAFYGNAGPSFLVGNDYASIFGTAEIGIQLTSPRKQGIVLGVAWGQNTIFHPSHFSFIKGFVGWRF